MSTPAARLASEAVVVQAPMSLTGSAKRIWKLTRDRTGVALVGLATVAVTLIALAWVAVLVWYVLFGLLLLPYRLIRRGQRKRRLEDQRHRETIAAVKHQD